MTETDRDFRISSLMRNGALLPSMPEPSDIQLPHCRRSCCFYNVITGRVHFTSFEQTLKVSSLTLSLHFQALRRDLSNQYYHPNWKTDLGFLFPLEQHDLAA